MIKLKLLLSEAKKLNIEADVNDAAEFLIRQAWKIMPANDKFSGYQLSLHIDNEEQLAKLKWEFSKKFFPGDDEYIKFDSVIDDKLEELEQEKNSRLASKVNSLDPLFILKKLVIRKTWEGAKQSLIKNSLGGGWGYKGGKISDEEAELAFNRLYKNAMGETVYDVSMANTYGRLSDLQKTPIKSGDNLNHIKEYSINIFIDHYAGYGKSKFEDMVKVYRGVNNPSVPIRPGDYVTFDKEYAMAYMRGKFGSVIRSVLKSKDLYVSKIELDNSELVYWPEGHQITKYEGHIPTFKEFWKEVNSL